MKNISAKRAVRRVFTFTNLFKVWLSRRQVDPHVCLCILSVAVCCVLFSCKSFYLEYIQYVVLE